MNGDLVELCVFISSYLVLKLVVPDYSHYTLLSGIEGVKKFY